VALTGVVLVATVGCSVHPGAAAVVDGRTISQDYLEETAADLGMDPAQALLLLISAPSFVEAAEAHDVAISTADARAELEAQVGGEMAAELGAGAIEVMRMAMSAQALGELQPDGATIVEETGALALSLPMDINPRYGDVDPELGQVTQPDLPWIVTSPPPAEESSTE
jgi:hypothetical protein